MALFPNFLSRQREGSAYGIWPAALVLLVIFGLVVTFFDEKDAMDEPRSEVVESVRHNYSQAGSYLSGRHAQFQGDMKRAARYLQDVVRRETGSPDIMHLAYHTMILSGRIEEAVAIARRMEDDDNVLVSRNFLFMLEAVRDGDYDGARQYADALPPQEFNTVFVPVLLQWLATDGKVAKKAAQFTDAQLIEKAGDFAPLIRYHMALQKRAIGDKDAALPLFRVIGQDAARLPYHVLQHLVLAYHDYGAEDALRTLLKEQEGTTQGTFLARLPEKAERLQNSFLTVRTAKEGVAEILYSLASILDGMAAREEAVAYLRLTLYLRPSHDPARLLLGNITETLQDYDQAIEFYESMMPGTLYHYKGQIRLAYTYWEQDKQKKARHLLEKLTREEPELIDALLTQGDLLRSVNKFREAATMYDRALERAGEIKKHHWPILYARGICYERAGEWAKAEPDFLKALELKPSQPDVLNYLGYSWLIQGKNIVEARAMIEEAIAARPQDAHIIDSMAWALYSLGEFDEAVEYMEQAITLSPRDPTLNDHLGDIYWRLGRKVEARFQWQRALDFEPEEPGMDEKIREKLAKGLPELDSSAMAVGESAKDNITVLNSPDRGAGTNTTQ